MEQRVILLNGPSSSGKSTLAKALKALIFEKKSETCEVVSIDDHMKLSFSEMIYEDDVFLISGDICSEARKLLKQGKSVIIDHVITSERIFRQLLKTLSSWPVKTVRVTCPLAVLKERELKRKDRCIGSAESSDTFLFPKEGYDLIVDTGLKTPDENAELIFNAFF